MNYIVYISFGRKYINIERPLLFWESLLFTGNLNECEQYSGLKFAKRKNQK